MSSSQTLAQAELAHQNGNLSLAQALYNQVLEIEPHVDALFGLATLFHQKKQYNEAIPLFAQALSIEPQAFDISYNYLLALVASNQFDEARIILNTSIRYCPKEQQLQLQLANIALKLGALDKAIVISPDSAPGNNIKCQAYMQLEQWSEAYGEAKKIQQSFPNEPILLSNLSICATKLDKFDEAITTFKKLILIKPNQSVLHLKFADLFLIAKQLENARVQLDIAIRLGDETITRFEVECKICRLENDKQAALIAANKAITLKPEAEFAWQVKHDLGSNEDNEHCIATLSSLTEQCLSYSYDQQHNLYTLAKAYQKADNYTLAFSTFDKANQLQASQFKKDNNEYNRETIERIYRRIKSINYPITNDEDDNEQHYFVVGMPRSGTTLVNRVLSQLDTIKSCGESNAIATLFEHKLYNESLSIEEVSNFIKGNKNNHQAFYRNFNKISQQSIVDKMPHNFRYVGAILATFPNAKVIQMRRSPVDLALSIYSQFFNRQHTYACNLEDIAHATFEANQLMDYWHKLNPSRVINVNYEDLATTPNISFSNLFEQLGIEWDENYLSFHKQNVASYTFSETQVRKPINTSKIGFSKHYQEQLQVFNTAFKKLANLN